MIRLHNVTKVYEGGTVAARDVSLDIQKGEFVFLVGASGSGKSTLIRLMLRQEPITRGQIWVAGKDITTLPNWKVPYLRRSIGTVFQDFKLLPNKTVSENVAFALEVLGRPRSVIGPQVEQVLDLVGLSDKGDRYPRQLSGGEQQRVSVARAFVNRPPILLADEPTGNLDPANSVGIMKLLDRINRTGTTIVMATHDHAIVDAMQRRVVGLERGLMIRDQASGRYDAFVAGEAEAPPAIDESAMDEIVPDAAKPEPAPEPVEPPAAAGADDGDGATQTAMDLDGEEPTS
ncbi:MAG: cell division ATP-binding protein FtsE [Acidimicrobiia bacterium]